MSKPDRKTIEYEPIPFSTVIEGEPQSGGVTITFEHCPEEAGTELTFIWCEDDNFGGTSDLIGEDTGSKWLSLMSTGEREAAGLIKALVELGDQLRPVLAELEGGG